MQSPALRRALVALAVAALPARSAVLVTSGPKPSSHLRATNESLVRPFEFHQKLLVCNAYPSHAPITVRRNEHRTPVDVMPELAFRQCSYAPERVQSHDKLDFLLQGLEIHGTFEIGDLPNSDAVLLLVLEKRGKSPLINFRSFAFPTRMDTKDAQLAIIDAYQSNSSFAHLEMEDSPLGSKEKAIQKRIEELNFDHVYSIQEGTYVASIVDARRVGSVANAALPQHRAKTVFQLAGSQSYVAIRTGDEGSFPERLLLFSEGLQSGGRALACSWLLLAALAALTAA